MKHHKCNCSIANEIKFILHTDICGNLSVVIMIAGCVFCCWGLFFKSSTEIGLLIVHQLSFKENNSYVYK